MKKIGKIFRLGGLGVIGALFSLASCSEWDDHYNTLLTNGSGNMSVWEVLQNDPELSDFCEVLQTAKVFRQHKATEVTYAQQLQGGLSCTVFAPKNGTFNKEELLELLNTGAKGDSIVEKKFIMNHICRDIVTDNNEMKEIRLGNGKRIMIGNGKIGHDETDFVNIEKSNVPTRNGVLQVMEEPVPYTMNIYEAFCDDPRFDVIGTQLKKYTQDKFDEANSLSSGMVDGVKVYVDSVVYETNKLFDAVGILNAEDSAYIVTVPSNEGWNRAWDEASQYFHYDPTVAKADSMQHYWTLRALLDDGIYSRSVQSSPKDSLVNWKAYSRRYPEDGHVFYDPFAQDGIMSGQKVALSNGELHYDSEWALSPEQTYLKVIRAEGESFDNLSVGFDKTNISTNKCTYNIRWVTADSISGNGYLDIVPQSLSSPNWNVTMKVPNTLSGAYDIYIRTLPQSTYDPNKKGSGRGVKFKAYIDCVDADGNQKPRYECVDINNLTSKGEPQKYFISNPEYTDEILIAGNFRFESCNFDLTNQKVQIRLESNVKTTQDKKTYHGEMFLDAIILRPKK